MSLMESVDEIQNRIFRLGAMIDAPDELLKVRRAENPSAMPYLVIDGEKYKYLCSERGYLIWSKSTTELDEFIFWMFSDVKAFMARTHCMGMDHGGKDPRRFQFSERVRLMAILNPIWAEKLKFEIEEILANNPYVDSR